MRICVAGSDDDAVTALVAALGALRKEPSHPAGDEGSFHLIAAIASTAFTLPQAEAYVIPAQDFLQLGAQEGLYPAFVWGRLGLLEECLALGAIDAVSLPVDVEELLLRIRGRRRAFANFACRAEALGLEGREAIAFSLLFEAGDAGITRTALCRALWGRSSAGSRRLDVLVSNLRKKLAASMDGSSYVIHARRGMGYAMSKLPVDNLWQSRGKIGKGDGTLVAEGPAEDS